MSELENEFALKKIKFSYTFLQKTTCFAFLCLFDEHEFNLTNIRRVRFRLKLLNGCQSLKKKFPLKKSRFDLCYSVKTTYVCILALEKHDFELEILQCVTLGIHRFGFCNKKLKTNQNLNWQSKNLVLIYVTPWKRHNLRFSCFFGWHDFKQRILQGIKFWTKINTTCQNLNSKT